MTFRLAIRAAPNSTNENVSFPPHEPMMRHTNFAVVVDEEDEREGEEKSGDVRQVAIDALARGIRAEIP